MNKISCVTTQHERMSLSCRTCCVISKYMLYTCHCATKTIPRYSIFIEYAAAVWDPYTKENQHKLDKVQRRAARYVCNNYMREEGCVTAMLHELGWRSKQRRRADIRLVFLYKCIHSLVALDLSSYLIP